MIRKIFICCILSLLAVSAQAQQSSVISYQGVIAKDGAAVPDGDNTITVTLYHDALGTNSAWSGWYYVHTTNGIFNVLLGSGDYPLPSAAQLDGPLFIGLRIGAGAELPLTQLSSAVSAMNVADGSITAKKMGTDYVSSISVNGQKVTGNGTGLNIVGGVGMNLAYDNMSNSLVLNTGASNDASLGKGAKAQTWDTANGGTANLSKGTSDFLGGGDSNTIVLEAGVNNNGTTGRWNTLTGGQENYIEAGNKHNNTHNSDSLTSDSVEHNFIGGGFWNSIYGWYHNHGDDSWDNDEWESAANSNAIAGGQGNSIFDRDMDDVGPGNHDYSWQYVSAEHNWNFIGGGLRNTVNGNYSSIVGGIMDSIDWPVVGSVIAGGENNAIGLWSSSSIPIRSTPSDAVISGGRFNSISGNNSAIAGGANLKLGSYSFGFNADKTIVSPTITNLSDSSQIAYFGDVDIMIGNTDDTARELRLYAPNTSLYYDPLTARYSSFQAGAQTSLVGSIAYTLPIIPPTVNQVLAATAVIPGNHAAIPTMVALGWRNADTAGGGNFWSLTGNSGTSPGMNYLGTNDDSAFEIHVDNSAISTGGNHRVMRYEPGAFSPNIIGGSSANSIETGLSGTAILSGGDTTHPNTNGAVFSVIAGGEGNAIDSLSEYCDIGGGRYNSIISSYESTILGGFGNLMISSNGVIGSGFYNTIENGFGNGILGGDSNYLYGSYSAVTGGYGNRIISADYATLGGGLSNKILYGSDYSVLGGGQGNLIHTIGRSDTGNVCLITIGSTFSPGNAVLAGGLDDTVLSTLGSLVGGVNNKIDNNATSSTIGGGDSNYVGAALGTLGGGYHNTITTAGYGSTIPGGVGLIAAASGQFVAGTFNIPDTTTGPGGTLAQYGNGMEDTLRSNAVTISKGGFITAYGDVPSTGTAPTREGTTYKNNTIEAWGYVNGPSGTMVDGIGVASCAPKTGDTGVYQIVLSVFHADGSIIIPTAWVPKNGSIVATLGQTASGVKPGMIVAEPIAFTTVATFFIHTYDQFGNKSSQYDFQFQVVLDQ